MVSSLLVEALSSPTDALLSFYDTYDHDAINEFPKAVAKHFSDIFRTDEALAEVRIQRDATAKQAELQFVIPDTPSEPLTILVLIPRSRPYPLSCHGSGHLSITRDVSVQVERWEMWGLGPVRSFPK
jgi:hypothetical protein